MTLYGYFRDRDELVTAMVDRGASQVEYSVPEGPWQERLRELMRIVLRSLIEHPSVVELRTRGPILNPAALRACETGLRILADAGLTPVESTEAWRLLFVYTFGYAAFGSPSAPDDVEAAWRAQLEELPAEDFPMILSTAAAAAAALSGYEQFERGLDLIIAGLASKASGNADS
jgi:AcrR family transcriptional regulator